MATKTTNYNLTKPSGSENADIDVINANMDIIDTTLAGKSDSNHTHREYGALIPMGTPISGESDLNSVEYLKVGNYYCDSNSIAGSLTNCPTNLAFIMEVYSPISTTLDNESASSYVYRVRKITDLLGNEYTQATYSSSTPGSFEFWNWKRVIKTDETINTVENQLAINFRPSTEIMRSGISYKTNGDEAVCFENRTSVTSWIFRTHDSVLNPTSAWDYLTPSFQIKNQCVAVNKLIPNGANGEYNLDVGGTANATTIYQNGKQVANKDEVPKITASTTDIGEGSSLATGTLYLVYE